MTPFQAALKARAEQVEEALALLLPSSETFPEIIHEAIRYSALGGGKRLRGVLVIEAYRLGIGEAAGRHGEPARGGAEPPGSLDVTRDAMQSVGPAGAVAAAVEMIHAYSLIHDDLPCMDDDDLRRGRPTNHRVFGEGIAVLAGDALLTRAFEVLSRLSWAGISEGTTLRVMSELAIASGTNGMIGGQVADLIAEQSLSGFSDNPAISASPGSSAGHGSPANPADSGSPGASGQPRDLAAARRIDDPKRWLAYIHSRKTGALIRASLRAGAILSGMSEEDLAHIDQYGASLGLAFQIVDDLLDLVGDVDALGKNVGSDTRQGKLTYPAVYGFESAQERAREEIERATASLSRFGSRAQFLVELARFVAERDR